MANDVWYYEKHGEQHGPVTQAELQALIERGEISRENMAWKPGERDWSETGSIEIFVPSFLTPPPVRPTAPPPPPPSTTPPPVPKARAQPPQAPPDAPPNTARPADDPPPPTTPRQRGTLAAVLAMLARAAKLLLAPMLWLLRQLRHRSRIERILGVVLAIAIPSSTIYIVLPDSCAGQRGTETKPTVAASTLPGTRVPVGYNGPVGQIRIDASPWANLTRLTSATSGDLAVPGLAATPLVLLVAPGTYQIELAGEPACTVTVAAEQRRLCSKVIRRIDAGSYYREVGW